MHIRINASQKTVLFGQDISYHLGKNGIIPACQKQEGDGCTPTGLHIPVALFYRAGRIVPPKTFLPCFPIYPYDGWGDDSADKYHYNHYVHHPYRFSAEHLYREDHVYDLILATDYNYPDAIAGRGSAIFIHLKSDEKSYTQGCIAFEASVLKRIILQLRPRQGFLVV